MRDGLTLRIVLGSTLLALLIGAVFAVLLEANLEQRDARTSARYSRAELADAERLLKVVVDLETGQRGFIITGKPDFLRPWKAARTAFVSGARKLADFADDPAQDARARRIAQRGTSYIDDYSAPLVDARRRGHAVASSLAATQEGKRRIDALRDEFKHFTTTESGTVAGFQGRVDTAAQRALVVAGSGLGLSVLLIAGFAGYLGRAVVRPVRRAAGMAGQLAGGDLTVRMPESGTGEIGDLERSFNTMGRSLETSRGELRTLADEQAALRRVATLVAHAVPPREVLNAVVAEVHQLLGPDTAAKLVRYEADGTATILAVRGHPGCEALVGTRMELEGQSAAATVLSTGRPARLDTSERDPGSLSEGLRLGRVRTEVGAPIVVDDGLWGAMTAAWSEYEAPAGSEARIAEFTRLVATAIANAQSRAALTASRARVAATADETRRRIERDLHDGAQQRLVHTIITLKLARRALGDEGGPSAELLDEALDHAERANGQLRELVRGILPSVLKRSGLRGAVEALASRSALPLTTDVTAERLPPALEATAYFIIAEALTNVTKHASAGRAEVRAFVEDGALHVAVRDDGVGGATLGGGSGLLGLQDRAASVDGDLRVESPPGGGTVIAATLPLAGS